MGKILNETKYFLKTLVCFLAACLLVPIILLTFIFVHYSNELVNYVLSIKYPQISISKTKKIRSLIDTRRNAGIFNFLIQVKGPCDFDQIKRYYEEHLTSAREKTGQLKFPKLRQQLVNCWGHYGWVKDTSSFNLNNHILLNTSPHRGYAVNDSNIQDFISDLVTKYIPSDLPQWQVIVIPTSTKASTSQEEKNDEYDQDEHYYILLKIHHLIIADEDDLHISEMLMLKDDSDKPIVEIGGVTRRNSKLNNISSFIRKPHHIENLFRHICMVILNQWNKFIYEFESLETPDGVIDLKITTLSQLLSVLLIIAVNVFVNYWKIMSSKRKTKSLRKHHPEMEGRYRIITKLVAKEVNKRHLSWKVASDAVSNSLQLTNLTKTWAKIMWQMNVSSIMSIPYNVYLELFAMRELIFKGETRLITTYSSRLSVYVPLLIYAQMEFIKICYEIFKAPVNIYEELVQYPSKEENKLHKMSYSGRKIVSFTKSIDGKQLQKRLTFSDEIRESDYILACLSAAIYDYFQYYNKEVPVPKMLNTTCRTMGKGYLTDNLGDKTDFIGGVVFLQLPLKVPDRDHAKKIHSIIEQIRRKQIMIYLASMGQTKYDMLTSIFPSVLTKICINYFSSNFPVTITEIHGENSEFQTLWGQKVDDVLLFRPPQSKTCLSLNIHRFGDKFRLAVMADTQLGPEHSIITRSFENYMETISI
ncbi:uncharacterized protein LOC111674922 [Lucilia cuprina]|uniref:uncharacterized protein LOC111674922 n=1 Tax=Lucilia cuprina TaxID=7375 RepID=UPI001F05AA98|nr:uncharacterized protein LOC111674922 [Lucilia cuprina]